MGLLHCFGRVYLSDLPDVVLGARSAWHTHPAGQRLVVMSGVGLTQEWGKPAQRIQHIQRRVM